MENFLETNSNEIQNLTNKTSTTSIADLYNKNESTINEIKDQSLNKEDNLPFLQRSSQKSLNTKTNLVSIDERNSFEKSYSTLNGPGTGPGIGLGTSTESNDSRHLQSSLISSSLQNQQTIITKSSQYTIMIDDLFIRKLLFQM
ncbi:hypothetical protein QR98_0099920 [Sarcoptes scabiei]|uniref:Uncharacterized protein n=1 Tax=Sarcoptes scabiei TaxID=52283 RepID=A0A132AK94_SARSC|nr:hypothetical protein QR98_0099920 [Sarcoptes scabiei]